VSGDEIPTVSFDELWKSSTWKARVYLDEPDPKIALLRVAPPFDAPGSGRMVIEESFVEKAEQTRVGWLENGRLLQSIASGATRVLALDRGWFNKQLRENPTIPPSLQVYISADRHQARKVNLTFEPGLQKIAAPKVDVVWSKGLSLDREAKQDYVELAHFALTFDPQVRFYDGEIPALGIVAAPSIKGVPQSIDLRLVPEPLDADGGPETQIVGDKKGHRSAFITNLPIAEEGPAIYRLMASDRQLRAAILQLQQPGASVCTAILSVHLYCAMEFDRERVDLVKESGGVEVSFANEQTVSISLANDPVSIVLRENGKPETSGTSLNVQFKDQRLLMQKSFGLNVRYNGLSHDRMVSLRWSIVREGENQQLAIPPAQGSTLPADGTFHRCAVPVRELLEASVAHRGSGAGPWHCVVQTELTPIDGTTAATGLPVFRVPILVDTDPDWVLCVDLGTSAVAAWCGLPDSGHVHSMQQLPLGAWLEQIDSFHDESNEMANLASGRREMASRAALSRLLPSHVGLASDFNLRDKFDLLSLGDLRAAGSSPSAVYARLKMLGRRYDVSAPFPSSERMHEYFDSILFELKRKLIACSAGNWMVDIGADIQVLPRSAGQVVSYRRVNLLDIFTDYFDELATYVVPRVLEWASSNPNSAESSAFRKVLEAWLDGPSNLRLIITHPTGMSSEKRRLYETATEEFAASFQRGRSGMSTVAKPSVVLIPESLAAARFGISRLLEQNWPGAAATGNHLFVTLDIGAGTYDVTVLTARIEQGDPVDWHIHSHFGLAVGGIELDRALTARIAEIFQHAAGQAALKRRFDCVDFALPSCVADVARIRDDGEKRIGMRFLNAVKAAKVRLTAEILARPAAGTYRWDESGPPLAVRLGQALNLETQLWPMKAKSNLTAGETFDIEGEAGASLRVENDQSISLVIRPEAVRGGELGNWIKVLGRLIPEVARAAARKYSPNQPPHWIITGRTALWPDLYSAIADTAKDEMGGQPGLVADRPYAANDMKVAVIQGAQMMASEPHLERGNRVFNPLAIVRIAARAGAASRVTSIHYIANSEKPRGEIDIDEGIARFQLVRAVPCLDSKDPRSGKSLLELLNEIPDCPPLWRPMSHLREISKAYPDGVAKISWETDSERQTTIKVVAKTSDILEVFGPFSEETVYVNR
jgi:hypothetical protein